MKVEEAIRRFKFWRKVRGKPFLADKDTGWGYKLLSYNVFTDRCRIRLSKFGYVEGYDDWSSGFFNDEITRLGVYA